MCPTKGRKKGRGKAGRVGGNKKSVLGGVRGRRCVGGIARWPRNCSIRLSGIFDAIDWTSVENWNGIHCLRRIAREEYHLFHACSFSLFLTRLLFLLIYRGGRAWLSVAQPLKLRSRNNLEYKIDESVSFLFFSFEIANSWGSRIEIARKNCNKRKDSELVGEKIATTSRAHGIYIYVCSYRAFICHGIGRFHTRCAILFSPIVRLRIGVNPLLPLFFSTDVLLQKIVELEWRERESVSPLWMYTYSRSLCLNSSLGKPDNAGEKCFPCGLMLVDPRCLAAWMGGSHLEERDLEAPFKGIAGRWWSVGQAKFHLFSLPV